MFIKAAEQGDAMAQCNLYYCYEDGIGVERDHGTAIYWVTKAAIQGYEPAKEILRKL